MNYKSLSFSIISFTIAVAASALLFAALGHASSATYAYNGPEAGIPATISPTIITTITVGAAPWGVGVNPQTNLIYVAN